MTIAHSPDLVKRWVSQEAITRWRSEKEGVQYTIQDTSKADTDAKHTVYWIYTTLLQKASASITPLENEGDLQKAKKEAKAAAALAAQYAITMQQVESNIHQKILAAIPDDVYLEIFGHLYTSDLQTTRRVCRRWNNLVKANKSLWFRHLELGTTIKAIADRWKSLQKMAKGDIRVTSLSLTHEEHRRGYDSYGEESESEYVAYRRGIVKSFQDLYIDGFIKSFPFKYVEVIDYKGSSLDADAAFWNALEDCENLKQLNFKSTGPDEFEEGWNDDCEISIFGSDSAIANCPIVYLEVNTIMHIDLSGFCFSALKHLTIKSNLEAGMIRLCMERATSTLEELQLTDVARDMGRCREELCTHDDITCSTYIKFEAPVLMTNLRKIHFVGRGQYSCPSEETEECDSWYRTARVSYSIQAPNLESLRYEAFQGWDSILFDSCCHHVKTVYIELNNYNVRHVYGDTIGKLTACKSLTLKTTFPLYTVLTKGLLHPFSGNFGPNGTAPARGLLQLEELILIDDVNITSEALIQFVKYKKEKECPLRSLTVKGCHQVRSYASSELKYLVEKATIENDPESQLYRKKW